MRLFLKFSALVVLGLIIHLVLVDPERRLHQAEYDGRYVAPKLAAYIQFRLSEQPLRDRYRRSTTREQIQITKELTREFEKKLEEGTLPPLKPSWEYGSPSDTPTTQP